MRVVKDLMVPIEDYNHVSAGAPLDDVIRSLAKAMTGAAADPTRPRDRGVLVIAADGRVLGKLSLWDVLSALKPNFEPPIDPFGRVEDTLLWSQWLRPGITERAHSIRVEDLVKVPLRDETIDALAPLDLAVHRLVNGRHLSLLVTQGEQIVGVLRLSDVFKAVGKVLETESLQASPA